MQSTPSRARARVDTMKPIATAEQAAKKLLASKGHDFSRGIGGEESARAIKVAKKLLALKRHDFTGRGEIQFCNRARLQSCRKCAIMSAAFRPCGTLFAFYTGFFRS